MRATLIAFSLLALSTPLAAQDFHWKGTLPKSGTLEVRGINGVIRATRATGTEAVVTATKRAKRGDPDEVEIRVVEDNDHVTICAVYPSRRGGRSNDCRRGGGDNGSTKDNDTEVAFEVQLPAGVRLVAATVNGDVIGRDLASDAEFTTVNGDVEVATTGVARGTTVNGSIDARLGKGDWTGDLEFTTVNGGIRIGLPDGVGCDIDATTVNGSVTTDFPITVEGRMQPRALRGRIGAGGRRLELETVNGGIELRRVS